MTLPSVEEVKRAMRITVSGQTIDTDAQTVASRVRGQIPEPIQKHWVDVDGKLVPVKQALAAGLGINRALFTSQVALAHLEGLDSGRAFRAHPDSGRRVLR